ncbi:cytochrome c oxidase assembly protein subunit 15 [Quadrisphaera sp. DSM 44207]|nr:cytochrome c oxidase assembly protein subunit 15 [Quadrisphaera sp. DSM 44207]
MGRGTTSGRWLGPVLVAQLVAEIGIVLTGGLVRLTGSGLGCPTWPQCVPGSYVPTVEQAEGFHKHIEFGNRLLTFVVGALAVAALVAVWRLRPQRPLLRLLAAAPLVGVLAQGVIGGITVRTGLNPLTVALHFLVSMALIAVSTLLVLRAREGDGPPRPLVHPALVWWGRLVAVVAAVVLVLGTLVTGAGPHSGDADEPARLAVDPRTLSWLHADAVLLFVGLVVGLAVTLRVVGAPAVTARRALLVVGVTLAQGALGYTQYALDLARPLVWLHMLGACLLVVAVTALLVSLRERGDGPGDAATGPLPPRHERGLVASR